MSDQIPKGRHEWVLKSDLDAAESELAATKAKLAEVMKRHPGCAAVRAERDAFRADLEQMRDLLPNDWQTQTELGGQVMIELKKQRDEAARLDEKLAEVERERDGLRGVAEVAHELVSYELDRGLRFERALERLCRTLASAGTDADRTEPPRANAGESWHDPHHDPECASCGHVASDHRHGGCGACCEDEESGDSAKCDCRRFREEEPKPEPQPSGVVMVGLRIDGPYADVSLWPLVDKSRVETMAYATSEEWAKRIAECCNRALRPELREGPAAPHGDRHEGD